MPGLQFLLASQNSDGGWGYFPGKQSWLEPTAYCALALHHEPLGTSALERTAKLLDSWALPEGGWRTSAQVPDCNWASSLCITLQSLRGRKGRGFDAAVRRLIGSAGNESSAISRVRHALSDVVALDPDATGWPYRPASASWVEPTAHAIIALRKASAAFGPYAGLAGRVTLGERMLMDRRCADGGWNYGNTRVFNENLPSYPETTGTALTALQHSKLDLTRSLRLAESSATTARSVLGAAWLNIGLRLHGWRPVAAELVPYRQDVLGAAIHCLSFVESVPFALENA